MRILYLFVFVGFFLISLTPSSTIYKTVNSKLSFSSEAPMELIKAESDKMIGLINTEKNTFAFQVSVISFEGFNSDLQREHFNENYMESTKFPKLKFVGKILGDVNFSNSLKKDVEIEGTLNVHGISKPRKLVATINKMGDNIMITCNFDVDLADHNISIPTIVNQKLAKTINVTVEAKLQPKE